MFLKDSVGSISARKTDFRRVFSVMFTSAIAGFALIATLWIGVAYHLNSVRERTIQATTQSVNNLAHVFEQEMIRTLREADNMILSLRQSYFDQTFYLDLTRLTNDAKLRQGTSYQIFLVNADGIVRASSIGPIMSVVDASDRDHFRAHIGHKRDELYISKPFLGRISGRWTMALSRAIRDPSGELLAVLNVTLDPMHWTL
jgi:hypothetical protein